MRLFQIPREEVSHCSVSIVLGTVPDIETCFVYEKLPQDRASYIERGRGCSHAPRFADNIWIKHYVCIPQPLNKALMRVRQYREAEISPGEIAGMKV